MHIRLYAHHPVATGLSWEQVQIAEDLAKATPAAEHFHFYKALPEKPEHPVNRWSLMAMHRIHFRDGAFEGANIRGWIISIPDASPTATDS